MVTSSQSQLLKAKVKNLLKGNSKLALNYFYIIVILYCTTCGIYQACFAGSTRPLWLNGNFAKGKIMIRIVFVLIKSNKKIGILDTS